MFANKTHAEAHELLKDGKVEEAIEQYTLALTLNPDHCDILSDRGVAYIHAKDQKHCFDDLNRAVELQPNYAYRYACRAFAKNHFGDINGAVEDYEKAVELDPNDAVAQNNLGLLLEQKGYQKEADERFARADKLSKQEDGLLDVIEDLETEQEVEPAEEMPAPVVEPTMQQEPESGTAREEFKKVFTSKKQFREFIGFIRNGFKLK